MWFTAPVVWTGLELARAHLMTGFLMAALAHTQVHQTRLIQISDLVGEYGVDFVVMMVAACITGVIFPPRRLLAAAPAVLILISTLVYGHHRLAANRTQSANEIVRTARIALIQGNSLADWKFDQQKKRRIMEEYIGLSEQAVKEAGSLGEGQPLDLIVWPETMYRNPLREFEAGFQLPTNVAQTTDEITAGDRLLLADLAANLGTPLLVGIDRIQFLADERSNSDRPSLRAYNSAALVDRSGEIVGTYDKFHLVMFGEYVPFSRRLPFLKGLSSLTGDVEAGQGPAALCTNDVCYAPNICYETVIPHVMRRHAGQLVGDNNVPVDVLVNLTNDAWYWGSSELDQHLACGVFRAVETRKPLVIAANGGISAWIDHFGRIRAQSPRQQPDIILADVELATMDSWYLKLGDWFAGACLTCCVTLAVITLFTRRTSQP
jgi:apolipoprotein N-acyltransferase